MEKLPQTEADWTPDGRDDERPGSWAFQLALCLLGPLFFVSLFFTILAPLPVLYLFVGRPDLRSGRAWWGVGLVIGLALSFQVYGWLWGSLSFFLLASLPALVLGELLARRTKPERAVLGAFVAVVAAGVFSAWVVVHSQGLDLIPTVRDAAAEGVRYLARHLLAQAHPDVPDASLEPFRAVLADPMVVLREIPGYVASFLLLLCALPCVALIRWNPKGFLRRTGITRDFLRRWRTPEWLVWPALLCGAFHIFEVPVLSDLARNLVKPILLIYFFQGMSILAYFLDSMRLRGPIRIFFYGMAALFLNSMVVSFGFFDLWFSFRGGRSYFGKNRQDKEN
jgi:hypothetical protein